MSWSWLLVCSQHLFAKPRPVKTHNNHSNHSRHINHYGHINNKTSDNLAQEPQGPSMRAQRQHKFPRSCCFVYRPGDLWSPANTPKNKPLNFLPHLTASTPDSIGAKQNYALTTTELQNFTKRYKRPNPPRENFKQLEAPHFRTRVPKWEDVLTVKVGQEAEAPLVEMELSLALLWSRPGSCAADVLLELCTQLPDLFAAWDAVAAASCNSLLSTWRA
ncbi:hypothetical protein DFH27DRAFT_527169 [Peziza echinospora]|nr:hypothetical protein DFH27DRAFT_527169 [Peziza echinospora]